jgi:hypothetical protein
MLWGERRGRATFGAVQPATDGAPHVAPLSLAPRYDFGPMAGPRHLVLREPITDPPHQV